MHKPADIQLRFSWLPAATSEVPQRNATCGGQRSWNATSSLAPCI